jgi:hypothetical protein
MRVLKKLRQAVQLITVVSALLFSAESAFSCQLCFPYPKKTAADYIIESETVVLARENPKKLYSYLPVEVLKGHYDGRTIPLLLDSVTKHSLGENPNLKVVLTQDRVGDEWRKLSLASVEYEPIVRELVLHSADWGHTSASEIDRARYFVPYLGHSDREIAQLAYLEIARVSYSFIRELKGAVSREEIYKLLRNIAYIEWQPLYILILGTSTRIDDVSFVLRRLKSAAEFHIPINLSAYAAAYVEMAGEEAVQFLGQNFLFNSAQDRAVVTEVLKALSIHGTEGRTELRDQIVGIYGELLVRRPELAGYMAKDFKKWQITKYAPLMEEILIDTHLDEPSELAVVNYLKVIGTQSADAAVNAFWARRSLMK